MRSNKQTLGINGTRTSGLDVRRENVSAAVAVANIVKSSLGPIGLDKMLVDAAGDVIVTNDGATILKRLDVEHPAARMLVDLAQLQDQEVGDGTTSVVIVAAELLKRAQELVLQGIHPTSIISGYKIALKEGIKYLQETLSMPVSALSREILLNIARTSMSSKILSTESDLFSRIAVDAIMSVQSVNEVTGDATYPRKAVGILKQHGKSARESVLINGFALNASRAAQGMPTSVNEAKIALVDFDLRAVKMKLGIAITLSDPTKAEEIKKRELDITKERIEKMIRAGANVILTTWGIEDTMLKYMVEAKVIGCRRVAKDDLRRIARATGGTIVHTMCDLEGEEVFDPAWLGQAAKMTEERFADDECMIIHGTRGVCSSIVLRGANSFVLDEMERAMNDSLWAVARTLEARSVVPGGGAVEVALSVHLENFARTLGSREQLAIGQFAEALLVIPKTLAMNAALDATELLAQLRVEHSKTAATAEDPKSRTKYMGLDLHEGRLVDNVTAGVLEPQPSKIKSLQFATEAAITILRIDDKVQLNPDEEDEQRRR
jgi:T-complex protein 1 subunit alpha